MFFLSILVNYSSAELRNEFVKTIRKMVKERNRMQILKNAGKQIKVIRKISEVTKPKVPNSAPGGPPRLERKVLRRWTSSASECATKDNGTEPEQEQSRPPLKKRENTF